MKVHIFSFQAKSATFGAFENLSWAPSKMVFYRIHRTNKITVFVQTRKLKTVVLFKKWAEPQFQKKDFLSAFALFRTVVAICLPLIDALCAKQRMTVIALFGVLNYIHANYAHENVGSFFFLWVDCKVRFSYYMLVFLRIVSFQGVHLFNFCIKFIS